jgi:glycosyltransferase 2 family protein
VSSSPRSVSGALRSPGARRSFSTALLLAALAFAVVALRGNWDEVRGDLARLSPADLALAAAAYAASLLLLWRSWLAVLHGVDTHRLVRRDSLTIFFAGQLGKYVPGSVWPIVIQAQLGRRNGVAASTMVSAYALFASLLVGSGAAVGVLLLTGDVGDLPTAVVLLGVAAGVALVVMTIHDHGLTRVARWGARRAGRGNAELRLGTAAGAGSTAWATASWVLLGLHILALARPLGADWTDLGLLTGGFAVAFVAGIVAVPVPAGAGIREAVMLVTMGVALGRPAVITVALLSRFVMIAVEVVMALSVGVPGAASWAMRRARRDDGDGPDGDGPDGDEPAVQ